MFHPKHALKLQVLFFHGVDSRYRKGRHDHYYPYDNLSCAGCGQCQWYLPKNRDSATSPNYLRFQKIRRFGLTLNTGKIRKLISQRFSNYLYRFAGVLLHKMCQGIFNNSEIYFKCIVSGPGQASYQRLSRASLPGNVLLRYPFQLGLLWEEEQEAQN